MKWTIHFLQTSMKLIPYGPNEKEAPKKIVSFMIEETLSLLILYRNKGKV